MQETGGGGEGALDMEAVFFRLHARMVHLVQRWTSPRVLAFVEWFVLANALLLLGLLAWFHVRFVSRADASCVAEVLRRELVAAHLDAAVPHVVKLQVSGIWSHLEREDAKSSAKLSRVMTAPDATVAANLFKVWLLDPVFVYASERGFLMLDEATRQFYQVQEVAVRLDTEVECFSESWVGEWERYLLDNFIGYDTVVLNAFGAIFHSKGFLYSVHSRELFNVAHVSHAARSTMAFKMGAIATTFFLFFITTTLVHHTLRETQERMLKFTFDLQQYVRRGLEYRNLIVNHVVGSLVFVPIMVGMLFFLFEFFNDQLLAFMVLSLVWVCELFSVICLRTQHNVRVFPRLFFLYFSSFHLYFFLFPGGFSYMALTCCVVFLQHAIISFFSRHEMPALLSGRLSAVRRRDVVLPEEVLASLAVRALVGGASALRTTTPTTTTTTTTTTTGTATTTMTRHVLHPAHPNNSSASTGASTSNDNNTHTSTSSTHELGDDDLGGKTGESNAFNARTARKKRTTIHNEPVPGGEILPEAVSAFSPARPQHHHPTNRHSPPSTLRLPPPASVGPGSVSSGSGNGLGTTGSGTAWNPDEEDDESTTSGWEIGGS